MVSTMRVMRKHNQCRRSRPSEGFSLVEPLILGVVLAIITSGTAVMLMTANRVSTRSDSIDASAIAVEADLTAIQRISRRFTCCSGTCSVSIPTNYGSTKPCAVNTPDDDRYFYPQMDDASTANVDEVSAVDTLCQDTSNTAFMQPLKTAVDAIAAPANSSRTTTIQSNHVLKVSYVDTVNGNTTRVAMIVPTMAYFCP